MAQGQGYASCAGLGVQSTLGTNVTRTKFWPFISEAIKLIPQRKRWSNARETAYQINTEVGRHSGGPMSVYGTFEGLESIFKQAFGASCLTTTQLSASSAYSQSYALKDALKSPGLSLEINRDVTAFLYEGMQIEQIDFIQNANDYLTINIQWVGRDETLVGATSPSFVTPLKIHHTQLAFTVGGVATTINSFRVTVKFNNTGFRGQLGNNVTREIIRSGKRDVSGEINLTFEDTTRYAEFATVTNQTPTNVALVMDYTGGAIASGAGNNYEFKLTLGTVNWEGDTPTVPSTGPITFTMPFVAMESALGLNDELVLFQKNTLTTVA